MFIHLYLQLMRAKDFNKEQLVKEKAIEMLVELGFDGFSMQKLAKEAGVSPATLYIYFTDKEDLIVSLGKEVNETILCAMLQGFDAEMSFAEGLKIQWKNRAKFWLENKLPWQFFEQIKNSPYRQKVLAGLNQNFKDTMGRFVQNAIKSGELVNIPVEVYWSIAFAPLYGLIKFHQEGESVGGRPFVWKDEYMHQSLSIVIKALKP